MAAQGEGTAVATTALAAAHIDSTDNVTAATAVGCIEYAAHAYHLQLVFVLYSVHTFVAYPNLIKFVGWLVLFCTSHFRICG